MCDLLNDTRDHGTLIPSSNPFWLSVRPSVRLTDGRCGFLVVSSLNFLFEGSSFLCLSCFTNIVAPADHLLRRHIDKFTLKQ